jgi:hypothetical protein
MSDELGFKPIRDRTSEEIAAKFSGASPVVTLIDSLVAKSSLTDPEKATLHRNVRHLEIIKAYKNNADESIWTSEDFTSINNAITAGNAKLS